MRPSKLYNKEKDLKQAKLFADWLMVNYSKGYSGYCWGYNFDWPNRNSFFLQGTPTIVNTVYIAKGFLDLYKCTKKKKYLDVVISIGNFILNDLNKTFKKDSFCFSYTPLDNTMIHNANMLGSSLLAILYDLTKEVKLSLKSIKNGLPCLIPFKNIYLSTLATFKVIESIKTNLGINL